MTQSERNTGENKMRVLGITGGVGAGKSTVLDYLKQRYGARVLQCDEAAKILQEPGGSCYRPMTELLGEDVLGRDGRFDRGKIAAMVFAQEEVLKRLNAIVHPAVKEYVVKEIHKERERRKHFLFVVEAALLLEDGYGHICDEIWYIHADERVRRQRLRESRGYSDKKITQIMSTQHTEEYFRQYCQFTVDNSGDNVENTYEQIDEGLKKHGFL